MALEVDSSELLRVLKPSLPLERLHLDSYSTLVTDATLELISQQYNKTLTHFLLLRDDPDFPDLSVNRNEDPLVLLAWRCTQLAVLVIHGEFYLFYWYKRIGRSCSFVLAPFEKMEVIFIRICFWHWGWLNVKQEWVSVFNDTTALAGAAYWSSPLTLLLLKLCFFFLLQKQKVKNRLYVGSS